MGVAVSIKLTGFAEAKDRLEKLAGKIRRPEVPMNQAAVYLLGQTLKAFREGGSPEKWAPLSLMSLFIRKNRKDAPNADARILQDSGRLMGSLIPFVDTSSNTFGVSTNVEYAESNEFGGVSKPSTIMIAAHQRKQTVGKKDARRTSMVYVREYQMNLQGGATIPPRPFFPRDPQEFHAWGYLQPVVGIFENYYLGQL